PAGVRTSSQSRHREIGRSAKKDLLEGQIRLEVSGLSGEMVNLRDGVNEDKTSHARCEPGRNPLGQALAVDHPRRDALLPRWRRGMVAGRLWASRVPMFGPAEGRLGNTQERVPPLSAIASARCLVRWPPFTEKIRPHPTNSDR